MVRHPYGRSLRRHVVLKSKPACWMLVCTALTPVAASAQAPSPTITTPDGNTKKLEEIVVTAQRRSQRLQNVPIAVSAFSARSLRASGVTTVKDLAQVVPSLQVSNTAGVYLPFIRGVGNGAAGTVGNESSVATYIDDVYYTRLSSAYLTLGSIDRVEVLNGPQGTLFGRNSSGGAIQMFTKDPGQKPEFGATFGFANYATSSGQLYGSIPLTDKLLWNVSLGGIDQRQGWGKSLATGSPADLGSSGTVRSKLVWQPSEETRIKVIGFYAHSSTDIGSDQGFYSGTYGATPNLPVPGYPFPPRVEPGFDYNSRNFYDNRLHGRNTTYEIGYGGSIRIDQDVGFADFVSISAARYSRGGYHLDLNYTPQNFVTADLNDIDNQITQEFQLKSKHDSHIDWIVGAYYLHSRAGYAPLVASGDILNFGVAPGTVENTYGIQTVNSYSGYGQATAHLGYNTNLTLGARLTEDNLSAMGSQTFVIPGLGSLDAAPTGLPNPYQTSANFGAFTYKAALDHHFTNDLMGYLSISRGYKSGAFNTIPVETAAAQPETVQAYELGFKSEFLEHRIRLNGALFWNDIKNPQVLTTVSTGVLTAVSLTNAQSARSRGVELGLDVVATDGLKLHGGVTYLDAVYTGFINAPYFTGGMTAGSTIAGPVLGNANGNELADVPKWRFNASADYTLDTNFGEWLGDVNVAYTSRYAWTADNHLWQRAVTLLNASVNFTPSSMRWMSYSVWGKNLADVHYYAIGQESAGGFGTGGYIEAPAPPLTFGATISVRY